MFWFIRNWRRNDMAKRPFPDAWHAWVQRDFPWLQSLDEDEQIRFQDHLKVFVWEKHWEGAHQLQVTEEMKVVIAGCAARLSRNISIHAYDRLTTVIIYPGHYQHPDKDHAIIYGEANSWGSVILSWQAVRQGLARPNDGHDTALHEFAHVLDYADGEFDGTPELHRLGDYQPWAQILSGRYEELRANPDDNVLRAYGAQNPAEFFAVATETFFEKPVALAREAPDLYRAMRAFYKVDPRVGMQAVDASHLRRPGGKRSLRKRNRT